MSHGDLARSMHAAGWIRWRRREVPRAMTKQRLQRPTCDSMRSSWTKKKTLSLEKWYSELRLYLGVNRWSPDQHDSSGGVEEHGDAIVPASFLRAPRRSGCALLGARLLGNRSIRPGGTLFLVSHESTGAVRGGCMFRWTDIPYSDLYVARYRLLKHAIARCFLVGNGPAGIRTTGRDTKMVGSKGRGCGGAGELAACCGAPSPCPCPFLAALWTRVSLIIHLTRSFNSSCNVTILLRILKQVPGAQS
jgi:hypothetical protein